MPGCQNPVGCYERTTYEDAAAFSHVTFSYFANLGDESREGGTRHSCIYRLIPCATMLVENERPGLYGANGAD